MVSDFSIAIDWETLESGAPEEVATFGAIGIYANGVCLSEAEDAFVKRIRREVHLSGYQLAQWLVWNWWRLRWEPFRRSVDWAMAHRLTTIGGGYVWPNVTCTSDGERILLTARAQPSRDAEPLRYVCETDQVMAWHQFEAGVDRFVDQVLESMRSQDVRATPLEDTWNDLKAERGDESSMRYRRIEASIGFDPDDGDSDLIETLIKDESSLGPEAVRELAADASPDRYPLGSDALREIARRDGFDANLRDCPEPPVLIASVNGVRPAWQLGEDMAQALRREEALGNGLLSDVKLSQLLGTVANALSDDSASSRATSFALTTEELGTKLVFHSPIRVSRRFAAARLLGDVLLVQNGEALLPALRSRTYRQKLQRAFAAELLCPNSEVRHRIPDNEANDETQEEVAKEFGVSPMVVRTQLVNKGILSRDELADF